MYEDGKKWNELLVKVEENNVMLRRMQRARRFGSFFWALKWLVLIALAAGAYYYLEPFINSFRNVWPGFAEFMTNLQTFIPSRN